MSIHEPGTPATKPTAASRYGGEAVSQRARYLRREVLTWSSQKGMCAGNGIGVGDVHIWLGCGEEGLSESDPGNVNACCVV